MKKFRIIISVLLMLSCITLWSQVAINMDESDPHQSAMLDVKSTDLGFLMPRMTTAERQVLTPIAAAGLCVYDTDLNGFSYFNGSNWVTIGAGMDSDWVINGNDMYSGVIGNIGIGTSMPDYKLTVDNGNALIKGGAGWSTNGDQARLYLGDNENSIFAVHSQGLRIRAHNHAASSIRWGGGNGVDYMTLNMVSGNVGIGTSSPTSRLHVVNSTSYWGMVRLQNENTGQNEASIAFLEGSDVVESDAWVVGVGSWGNLGDFVIGRGDIKLKINENGKVGIGTSNPSSMLDVAGTINLNKNIPAGVALRINGLPIIERNAGFVQWGGADNSYFQNRVGIGTYVPTTQLDIRSDQFFIGGEIICGNFDLSDYLKITSGQSFDHNPYIQWQDGGSLVFATDLGSLSEKMRISSNGNIGIGTTNPTVKLHLEGGNDINLGTGGYIVIGNMGSTNIGMDDNEIMTRNNGAASPLYINDNGGSVILNRYSGNVGIGTDSPTHKLSVNGTIRSKEIIVNTGWSDFVFEDDYNLITLTELENFIIKNKHLPDIPNAKEVKKNGVSLGNMDSKLLQKIEELTLYVIEIKKENEQLRKAIQKLVK